MDDAAIRDLFCALGPVSIRRMFGGKGIYADGLIVAVEVDGELWLKADLHSAPRLQAAGSRQWTYQGKKAPVKMPYWRLPDDAHDDPDLMAEFAREALAAAERARK